MKHPDRPRKQQVTVLPRSVPTGNHVGVELLWLSVLRTGEAFFSADKPARAGLSLLVIRVVKSRLRDFQNPDFGFTKVALYR